MMPSTYACGEPPPGVLRTRYFSKYTTYMLKKLFILYLSIFCVLIQASLVTFGASIDLLKFFVEGFCSAGGDTDTEDPS